MDGRRSTKVIKSKRSDPTQATFSAFDISTGKISNYTVEQLTRMCRESTRSRNTSS